MRVIVDGEVAFRMDALCPELPIHFRRDSQIEVLVGSGAAIRTVYNGRDLGLMGTFGQVVNNIYTADEIITPTALPSPTSDEHSVATSTVPPTANTKLNVIHRFHRILLHLNFALSHILCRRGRRLEHISV